MTIASNGRAACPPPGDGAATAASSATPPPSDQATTPTRWGVDPTRMPQRGGAVDDLALPRRPDVAIIATPTAVAAMTGRRGLGEEVDVQRRNAGPRQLVRERAVERAEAAAAVHDHHCGNRGRGAGRPAQLGGNGAAPARVVRAHTPGAQPGERRRRGRRDRRERAHERGQHDNSGRTRHRGTIRHKALCTLQTKPASSSREGWESRPASSRRRGASRSAGTGTTAGISRSRP